MPLEHLAVYFWIYAVLDLVLLLFVFFKISVFFKSCDAIRCLPILHRKNGWMKSLRRDMPGGISEAVFRLFAVCCWYCFMIKWEFTDHEIPQKKIRLCSIFDLR